MEKKNRTVQENRICMKQNNRALQKHSTLSYSSEAWWIEPNKKMIHNGWEESWGISSLSPPRRRHTPETTGIATGLLGLGEMPTDKVREEGERHMNPRPSLFFTSTHPQPTRVSPRDWTKGHIVLSIGNNDRWLDWGFSGGGEQATNENRYRQFSSSREEIVCLDLQIPAPEEARKSLPGTLESSVIRRMRWKDMNCNRVERFRRVRVALDREDWGRDQHNPLQIPLKHNIQTMASKFHRVDVVVRSGLKTRPLVCADSFRYRFSVFTGVLFFSCSLFSFFISFLPYSPKLTEYRCLGGGW